MHDGLFRDNRRHYARLCTIQRRQNSQRIITINRAALGGGEALIFRQPCVNFGAVAKREVRAIQELRHGRDVHQRIERAGVRVRDAFFRRAPVEFFTCLNIPIRLE